MIVRDFIPALEKHEKLYGKAPLKVAAAGGFTSKNNADDAKEMGVRDIAFSSLKGNKLTDLIKSEYVYKKLRKWRAGIEGVISAAKRAYGLSRCNLVRLRILQGIRSPGRARLQPDHAGQTLVN